MVKIIFKGMCWCLIFKLFVNILLLIICLIGLGRFVILWILLVIVFKWFLESNKWLIMVVEMFCDFVNLMFFLFVCKIFVIWFLRLLVMVSSVWFLVVWLNKVSVIFVCFVCWVICEMLVIIYFFFENVISG